MWLHLISFYLLIFICCVSFCGFVPLLHSFHIFCSGISALNVLLWRVLAIWFWFKQPLWCCYFLQFKLFLLMFIPKIPIVHQDFMKRRQKRYLTLLLDVNWNPDQLLHWRLRSWILCCEYPTSLNWCLPQMSEGLHIIEQCNRSKVILEKHQIRMFLVLIWVLLVLCGRLSLFFLSRFFASIVFA